MLLTSTNLGDHSLREGAALCQLLSEALTHVVINIIGPQELLKSLKGVENQFIYCEDETSLAFYCLSM